jgi:hypothetical protein
MGHRGDGGRMIVYTATIGRRLAPQRTFPGAVMVCFSDIKPPAPWHWVPIKAHGDFTRQTRRIKLLPWEHFEQWDECVWRDANIEVTRLPDMDADIAIHTHRDRDCIFDEAQKCIEHGKDDPGLIRAQIAKYSDHPPHWGLWETQIVYRRNTPEIRALCEDWWAEIESSSRRDQISLPVVLRRHGIRPESLGPSVWKRSQWCKRYRK